MLYALGEVLLVMIGILLALQVNNWNQEQETRREEKTVLAEILKNLRVDLDDFENNITHLENTTVAARAMIHAFQYQFDYHDSLAYHMYYLTIYPHFSPNVSGYELLNSKGLDIISNDSIRQQISTLYATQYEYIETWEDERSQYNLLNVHRLRNKYLGLSSLNVSSLPASLKRGGFFDLMMEYGAIRGLINFEQLINDSEFHSVVKEVEIHARFNLYVHTRIKKAVEDLIIQIENETMNR